jgi:hypothetical protein
MEVEAEQLDEGIANTMVLIGAASGFAPQSGLV